MSKVARAVQNNARWCDALCRAHHVPGEFHAAFWMNHGTVPPFTPKLITLAGLGHEEVLHAAIRSLVVSQPEAPFGVKDAFQCLGLAPLGLRVLFDAMWIYRDPATAPPVDSAEELEWLVVHEPDELAEWEFAWRGGPANGPVDREARVFVPSLLEEPGLHFLAGRRAGAVVASGALCRTDDVVGLSNVFSNFASAGPVFPGCVRLAQELYPGIPIVGYERDTALLEAEKAGFERVRGLTVWQHSPATS
jgi:hypothetical protein